MIQIAAYIILGISVAVVAYVLIDSAVRAVETYKRTKEALRKIRDM